MGGIESMIWNFCLFYKNKGYHVDVLTFKSGGVFIKKLLDEEINVTVIEKKEGVDYSLIFKLIKYFRQNNYDVIHTNNYASWLYVVISSIMSLRFFRVVHTEHSLVTNNISRRLYIEKILSYFTYKIVTVSENVAGYLRNLGKINSNKLEVIHNGINVSKFKSSLKLRKKIREKYGISNEAIVIGAIGRLVEVKDHETLILCACELITNNPNYVCVIIGDGYLKNHLNNLIIEMEMTNKIFLLGEQQEINEYLNILDVYIMTSLSEGFSIGLMEAMSTEIPVIVTKVGGNTEIITDGENGILIEPKDVTGICEAVEYVVADSSLMECLGKNARKTVDNKFNELGMYRRYEELYFD